MNEMCVCNFGWEKLLAVEDENWFLHAKWTEERGRKRNKKDEREYILNEKWLPSRLSSWKYKKNVNP
jgi:hypothetical protein